MYNCWTNVPEPIRRRTAEMFSKGGVTDGWKMLEDGYYYCPLGYAFREQGVQDTHTPPSMVACQIFEQLQQSVKWNDVHAFIEDNDNNNITDYYEALGVSPDE